MWARYGIDESIIGTVMAQVMPSGDSHMARNRHEGNFLHTCSKELPP